MTGWKISIFNRKYIFIHGGFSYCHVRFLFFLGGGIYNLVRELPVNSSKMIHGFSLFRPVKSLPWDYAAQDTDAQRKVAWDHPALKGGRINWIFTYYVPTGRKNSWKIGEFTHPTWTIGNPEKMDTRPQSSTARPLEKRWERKTVLSFWDGIFSKMECVFKLLDENSSISANS